MFPMETNELEIFNTIMHSKAKYSEDYRGINCFFKKSSFSLSKFLSELLNDCFTNGSVPKSPKVPKDLASHKDGHLSDANSHCTISFLPITGKALEKFLFNRFIIYFNKFDFFQWQII